VTPPDPIAALRALITRIGRPEVREQLQRPLALWELGYLREAISQFRLGAERVLERIAGARGDAEVARLLGLGQSARAVERLYRDLDALPARVALHLHTLLAWGNYGSHHQRLGHDARVSDLAVLCSILVELEQFVALELERGPGVFEGVDPARREQEAEALAEGWRIPPSALRRLVAAPALEVHLEPHRVTAPSLALELIVSRPSPVAAGASPYRGLRAFDLEDSERFFGRALLRERLEDFVGSRRLTVVSGASGAGKTSLLRAGVIPLLLDLGCAVLFVDDYPRGVLEMVRGLEQDWPARPLVLVLDQLERAILPDADRAILGPLFEIIFALGRERPAFRVVVGIREDFLGAFYREARSFDGENVLQKGDALFAVGPLEPAEAREAISRPLDGTGVTVEAGLLEGELLSGLADASGTLPARLQIVCERLFAAASDDGTRRIDRALYARLGGAERLLASYLDQTLASPRYEGSRELARGLLRAMTDAEGRRWADAGALWASISPRWPETDAVEIASALERLIADRLVVSRPGPAPERVEYSLMHDQLVSPARALSGTRELELQLAGDRLQQALAVWTDPARRELLRGRWLRLVESHWRSLPHDPTGAARALLAASRRARRRARAGLGLLVATALLGLALAGVQLRRATLERDRAVLAADQGVLLRAQAALDRDPTFALAWARNIALPGSVTPAFTIVREAQRRGVAVVLRGHEDLVTSAALSADGRTVATASRDGALRLYDSERRSTLGPALRGHVGHVNRVRFLAGDRELASVGADGSLRIWTRSPARASTALALGTGPLYALAVSPDGRGIAVAGADHRVHLLDRGAGGKEPPRRRLALEGHEGEVMSLAWSRDGRVLASASLDRTVRLWDPSTGVPLGPPIVAHSEGVFGVALSPDGRQVASAGRDGTVRTFRTSPALSPRLTLPGLGAWVLAVAFSPDGRTLAAAGSDKKIHLFEADRGEPSGTLVGHLGFVDEVEFSSDGRRLISASQDQTARLWDLHARAPIALSLLGHDDEVRAVAFAPAGRLVASGSRDRTVRLWRLPSGSLEGAPLVHRAEVRAIAFSPDGALLAAGGGDGMVVLWSLLPGPPVPTALPLSGAGAAAAGLVNAVAFTADGRGLVAGVSDGSLRLWDVARRTPRRPIFDAHAGAVHAVAVSRDGHLLASGGADRVLRLWRARDLVPLATLVEPEQDTLFGLAFSPRGTLAAATADGSLRLFDPTRVRAASVPLHGHGHFVLGVAFSPDGALLASGSSDGTVRVWDAETRSPLGQPLLGHGDWVNAVAFSPDGSLLASASSDRSVRLWALFRGSPDDLRAGVDRLTNLRVTLDGRVWLGGEAR
jgi:WD40 repeat protein